MTNLKEFMLLFRYEPSNESPTTEQLAEIKRQWSDFIGAIAMDGKLVSTYQLGLEGKKINTNHSLEEGVHISEGKTLGGNMVLKAESIEYATQLAQKCPILYMGGSVEIRDILPVN